MSTCFSALMCHAPIVVPAVGGDEIAHCQRTTRAMREVASRAVASRPDRLVLVSPHAPRLKGAWGAYRGPHRGSLADFRAPQVRVELPDAPEVAEAVGAEAILTRPLDHGAMVPLSFLWEAGWRGPTAILALPWEGGGGQAVGAAIAGLPGRTAMIASGDMSHRLQPGAPSGYHPRAAAFDRAFVAGLRAGRWAEALAAEPRALAAEDVVDSTRVAMAAVPGPNNAEVLSYEGPWGVGYTEAVFWDEDPPLYAIARAAVTAWAAGQDYTPPPGGPPSAGVFVTLRQDEDLRGCIGHLEPTCAGLREEVATVAVASASNDPRFRPVRAEELPDLRFEISVLEPPEPVPGPEALDPRVWGVVVSSGGRRGVLLPDIDGIDTVDQQVAIARKKAGIRPSEAVELERFRVRTEVQP
jgi:hypothetical protein